jgi:glycosyltransferase involved in cell wall biosynthesis
VNSQYRFYSVIVPSFNRLDEIKELIPTVEMQDFDKNKFELIIVDDGSTDDTVAFLEEYQIKSNIKFNYQMQKNQGPGAARNNGMESARGDFFIFIDSDCTVPVHWLSEIDILLSESKADAFGGPDSYRDDFSPVLKAINYSMTSFITTGGLRGKKGKKLAKFYPRSFNMGLSRKLWEKIGGFGNLRHGQDIEFSNRIIKSQANVAYIDKAFVYHKRRTNFRRFYRQVYNWGVARINLYKIDKSMLEPLHAIPAIFTLSALIIFILAIFFDFFRVLFVLGFAGWCLIIIFSMIDAFRIYKEIIPAILVPFIIPAQIFGYGLGFINNFIRRIILGKPEKVGFKKSYYK